MSIRQPRKPEMPRRRDSLCGCNAGGMRGGGGCQPNTRLNRRSAYANATGRAGDLRGRKPCHLQGQRQMPEVARCQVSGMGRDGLDPAWLCQGIRYTVTHFYRMVFACRRRDPKSCQGGYEGNLLQELKERISAKKRRELAAAAKARCKELPPVAPGCGGFET